MTNVLYLVHRIPFPPNKGDKIRSYHLLKFLAREHRVYLGAFIDDPEDRQHLPELKKHCVEVFLRPSGRWRSRLGALAALGRGRSLSVGYYRDRRMKDWVEALLKRHSFDAVVAFSSTMAQYLPGRLATRPAQIADFVDVDSDKWRQYAAECRWPLSLIYRYEARALGRWEAGVLEAADVVTVVSPAESRIVPGLTKANQDKVRVVANGVDMEFFDPAVDCPDPYGGNRHVVVFTGAMNYYANEDGVVWFTEHVWPGIRSQWPDAEFFIVGSNPTGVVSALGARPGVTVTGRVADVRPYIRHAAVAVAPLRLARGVQNKVLEALAMNRPVVATPQALRGLEGTPPDTVTEAASSAEFLRAVGAALSATAARAGDQGRDYVRTHYDWTRNLGRIGSMIEPAVDASAGADLAGERLAR